VATLRKLLLLSLVGAEIPDIIDTTDPLRLSHKNNPDLIFIEYRRISEDIFRMTYADNESSPGVMRRRCRPPRSCAECRRRKVKCDRDMPCSHCVISKKQCTYNNEASHNVMLSDQTELIPASARPASQGTQRQIPVTASFASPHTSQFHQTRTKQASTLISPLLCPPLPMTMSQ
jgi:hypothetical protein